MTAGTDSSGARTVHIGERTVGRTKAPYVVAELSANHGGRLQKALDLVKAAADNGADAIKLQTFTPDSMTLDSRSAPFVVSGGTPWDGRSLYDLYVEAQTPLEWHEKIASTAKASGIGWFSTPFDRPAVEFLEGLDVPAYKIASFEILDHELIEAASSKNKPVIISTGMATRDEIDEAVTVARNSGTGGVVVLRCSSAYPAPSSTLDLSTILDMEQRWDAPVGFSDHTVGPTSAITAVALGACLVEKHLTMRRSDGGPDAEFSCEPQELRVLVDSVHNAWESLGDVRYGPNRDEAASVRFRRSLWFVADLEVGDVISQDAVRSLRPAGGLPPKHLAEVIGRHAVRQIRAGTPVAWDLVD